MYLFVQLVTLSRIPVSILLATLMISYGNTMGTLGIYLALLVLIEMSDFLDGTLARKFKVVSEWGAMLDPYSDAISRVIMYWGFAVVGVIHPVVPLVMTLRDVTVAYCRIVMTKNNHTVSANFSGKAKAVIQAVGAYVIVLIPVYPENAVSIVVTTVSIVVGLSTALSSLQYIKTAVVSTKS